MDTEHTEKDTSPWTAEQLWDIFGWSTSVLADMMKCVVRVIRADDKTFPKYRESDYSYEDWKFTLQFFRNGMTRDQRLRIRAMLAKMVQRGLDDDMFSFSKMDHRRTRKGISTLRSFQVLLDEFLGESSSVALMPPSPIATAPVEETEKGGPIFIFADPVD